MPTFKTLIISAVLLTRLQSPLFASDLEEEEPELIQTTSGAALHANPMGDDNIEIIKSSRKRKYPQTLVRKHHVEVERLVKKVKNYAELEQNSEGFFKIPIELQGYILSFLNKKDFLRASHVSQGWRRAAYLAGENKALDLSRKQLGQEGCHALVQIPFTHLILWSCKLRAKEAHILCQSSRLKELNLAFNSLGDEGARALGNLKALTILDLRSNNVKAEGARALGTLTALTSLNLTSNRINDEGVQALTPLTALTSLNLGYTEVGDKGVRALGTLTALTYLNLTYNRVGDEGVRALGTLTTLTFLNLCNNRVRAEGARALSNLTTLITLNMKWNRLGDEGVQALSNLTALTSLNIESNYIGKEGKEILEKMTSIKDLRF